MKDSLFDLLSLASSTKFKILDAVELLKVLFTFTFNTPDIFTQPDMTESPNATSLGTLLLLVLPYLNLNYLQLLLRQAEFFRLV